MKPQMPVEQRLRTSRTRLRETIAETVKNLETWATIEEVAEKLGLTLIGAEGHSKPSFMAKMLKACSDEQLVTVADRMIGAYPGHRKQPDAGCLSGLQDDMDWLRARGVQELSNAGRMRLAEALDGLEWWGRIAPKFLMNRLRPGTHDDWSSRAETTQGARIARGSDWRGSAQADDAYVKSSEYLRLVGYFEWPDKRVLDFFSLVSHPEFHDEDSQCRVVSRLEDALSVANIYLVQVGLDGRQPIYQAQWSSPESSRAPRYLIFGCVERKPDLVVSDVLHSDLMSPHPDDLIYDVMPPSLDGYLHWDELVSWWLDKSCLENTESHRQRFGERLLRSMDSDVERFFFKTYFRRCRDMVDGGLPALVPQVWLHYDPRVGRREEVVVRQRLDFMMILPRGSNVIIEIDGKQHYCKGDRGSPALYAKQTAEDRRVRLLGYEVYRFGGYELHRQDTAAQDLVADFFGRLFGKHGLG